MKIYLANSLFTKLERDFNEEVCHRLEGLGYEVYLPQRDGGQAKEGVPVQELFKKDITALNNCDIIVAILNGSEPDSGTVFEVGYACALDKPIYAFRDDFRSFSRIEDLNLMISESCWVYEDLEEIYNILTND